MNIKILLATSGEWIDAEIKDGKKFPLPSFQNGWRFNFVKHSKSRDAHTYVLIAEKTPGTIEGCLIYKMRESVEPYMAYIEVAPHNKGESKLHDHVAGCLIAFACRLSFILGKGPYKGWLAFDVQEASKEDERTLMGLYSKKYKAVRIGETTMMVIAPEEGEQLIRTYLEN